MVYKVKVKGKKLKVKGIKSEKLRVYKVKVKGIKTEKLRV